MVSMVMEWCCRGEHWTLWAIKLLIQYDNIRTLVITHEIIQKIVISMYKLHTRRDTDVFERLLHILMQDDQFRALLSMEDICRKIIPLLGNPSWAVRYGALKALDVFLQHEDISDLILTKETIQRIFVMLADPHEHVHQRALQTITVLAQYSEPSLFNSVTVVNTHRKCPRNDFYIQDF
ncbi:hypothetical protein K438DRAFT_312596 [Mycena galopus ATCC 62051]|nr:hypothetical protein K438DRAFT_312596 [Mycena galopus ATCC 62051]